jgi:hypothetical protein
MLGDGGILQVWRRPPQLSSMTGYGGLHRGKGSGKSGGPSLAVGCLRPDDWVLVLGAPNKLL